MKNLLKTLLFIPFIGGCTSINVNNYPENWATIDSNKTKYINGSFQCKGESKSPYSKNIISSGYLVYLLEVDQENYRKCQSVSFTQVDTSSLTINIQYENKVLTKTLNNNVDYEYKDGWYFFSRKKNHPYSFGAYGIGTQRVSFALNASDNLVAKTSSSSVGVILVIPLINVDNRWNVFNRI